MAPPASTVRTAWAADAEGIAAVQARAWRSAYADLLPAAMLADLDEARVAESWRAALVRPPSGQHHVLVALDDDRVVGFTATAPCADADAEGVDGEVLVFHVDPDATRRGHGSRLLAALADTLRADGFRRGYVWLFAADDPQRQFFTSAGWAPTAPTASSTCTATARSCRGRCGCTPRWTTSRMSRSPRGQVAEALRRRHEHVPDSRADLD